MVLFFLVWFCLSALILNGIRPWGVADIPNVYVRRAILLFTIVPVLITCLVLTLGEALWDGLEEWSKESRRDIPYRKIWQK